MYSTKRKLTEPLSFRRDFTNKFLTTIALSLTILGAIPLISLLWDIIGKG
jgi:hypothetical protein